MKQFIKITEPDGTFFTACKWNNDLSLILKDLEID